NSKSKSGIKNSIRSQVKKKLKKLAIFRATLYQVLCDHNPNIITLEEDFVEYLAEQILDLGVLDENKEIESVDEDERNASSTLSEQEIISRIFEIVKDDFITFEVCNDENECLKICKDVVVKWKSINNLSVSTTSLSDAQESS
ncbi:3596_t:CDS:2, partial [Acaulospora colombiana]